jgi:hypothetical protein
VYVSNEQLQNGWDPNALDMSNLPSIDSSDWLQCVTCSSFMMTSIDHVNRFLSAENCVEIMSVPGYDPSTMMSWDTPDIMMADPFNLRSAFG